MKYARIVAEVCSRAWALREETLWSMQELIRLQASGVKFAPEEIRERIAESNERNGYKGHAEPQFRFLSQDAEARSGSRNGPSSGTVAVIPVMGVVAHRMSMMDISGPGGASIQKLTAQFRQALEDGNCKAVVFDVDSPGGSVEGVMELASEIFEARKQKPITAVCNAMACSAAYWLAAAAGEVVVTPSGQCGSIGVYMLHQDESEALAKDGIKISVIKAGKYKAEGNPSEPLSPEAREAFQGKVDAYYSMFVKAVGQYRGASQAAVREGYGQGRSLLAGDAVKQNLADRVGTLDDVLGKYGVKSGSSQLSAVSSQPKENASSSLPLARSQKLEAKNPSDPDEPDQNDDNPCGCACAACQGCETKTGNARADDMSCQCGCEACKACDFKGGARSQTISQTAAQQEKIATAAGVALAMSRRRRQLSLS